MTTETVPTIQMVHDEVRARYAAAATTARDGGCCTGSPDTVGGELYSALERAELPEAAVLASLGCGNPIAVAELHEGERVLDLGSGGGIDVLLSAKRVGPTGRAIGLDMTDEMLALAQRNAAEAGATNVEFIRGHIEDIRFRQILGRRRHQQLRDQSRGRQAGGLPRDRPGAAAGGRMGITDIVAEDRLTAEERAERGSYVGCIAGALSFSEFQSGLEAVGLTDVSLTATHDVADGMVSAIVKATKPADAKPLVDLTPRELPVAQAGCGCGSGGCC